MVTLLAVLIVVGIDWDGRRQILGVETAHRKASPRSAPFCWACARAG